MLPIVWITGTTLYVPELDQAFYNCISEVKKGYEVMFPETEWTGKIEVTKAIECDRAAEFGKCAMFYSGGIDSTQTLISHLNEQPMLVSVWGSDIEVENQIGWEFLKNGIDVLMVEQGDVRLYGYSYGFIGGCCGKISKDILAFTGKLILHRDCDRIKSFLRNYNIYSLELSNKPLTDVGSIFPVIQEAE